MSDWVAKYGNARHHRRYKVEAVPAMKRRKCRCGCERRITHMGAANGVGLYWGCELSVARWVRDGR